MIRTDRRGSARPVAQRAARIVIYDPGLVVERDAWAPLKSQDFDLVTCPSSASLLEEILQRAPAVAVFALRRDAAEDLGVLHLLRRASPELPLVLLVAEGSLATRRVVQEMRPVYYGVCPIEPAELHDAVSAAVAKPRFAI